MSWKAPFVIGSTYRRRRKRPSKSTSMVGGKVPAYVRWNRAMALAYCSPRKMRSASRSRRTMVCQAGIATLSIRLTMLSPTSSAAIA